MTATTSAVRHPQSGAAQPQKFTVSHDISLCPPQPVESPREAAIQRAAAVRFQGVNDAKSNDPKALRDDVSRQLAAESSSRHEAIKTIMSN